MKSNLVASALAALCLATFARAQDMFRGELDVSVASKDGRSS